MKSISAMMLLALLSVQCSIKSNIVHCDNDIHCPIGTVCNDTKQCVFVNDILLCSGKEDFTPCSDTSGSVCIGGLCTPVTCGNGGIDPFEHCDDGNRTSGDGCRGDCGKIENCGDSIVDDNEQCDDGNDNPLDTCNKCSLVDAKITLMTGIPQSRISIEMGHPYRVSALNERTIYVSDSDHNRIFKIHNDTASLIAGTNTPGFAGDGGASTAALLNRPTGTSIDGLGNILIADTGNNVIRKILANGTIVTVAGNGIPGNEGDGGLAVSANLKNPQDVAWDGLGNFYIADTGNNVVRKVDTSGKISTVFGKSSVYPDILDAPQGIAVDNNRNVIIADTGNNQIKQLSINGERTVVAGNGQFGFSGDLGLATNSMFASPRDVDIDVRNNDIYVADTKNFRIRVIRNTTKIITTFAGTGVKGYTNDDTAAALSKLNFPNGLTVHNGVLYIADSDNNRIRYVDLSENILRTSVGNGGAAVASSLAITTLLNEASSLTLDGLGNIYIADSNNNRVHKYSSGFIKTIAGSGPVRRINGSYSGDGHEATHALIAYPQGVAVDSLSNIYISDTDNNRIRKVTPGGEISTVVGTGEVGDAINGNPLLSTLNKPRDMIFSRSGHLYFSDTANNRVKKLSSNGTLTVVAGNGLSGFAGDDGNALEATLAGPTALAIDGSGNLYISDTGNNRVRVVDTSGVIRTIAGGGNANVNSGNALDTQLAGPSGIFVDGQSNVYISDTLNHRIIRIDAVSKKFAKIAGGDSGVQGGDGGLAALSSVSYPSSIGGDANGNIYFIDNQGDRVRKISKEKIITTGIGFIGPNGVGNGNFSSLVDSVSIAVMSNGSILSAGGVSGQITQVSAGGVKRVAGRYPQAFPTQNLAYYQDSSLGTIGGMAYDNIDRVIYVSDYDRHCIYAINVIDLDKPETWSINFIANISHEAGFRDSQSGDAAHAQFRNPAGLFLDRSEQHKWLFIADKGNHSVRILDLDHASVHTIANPSQYLGFFGDGGRAINAKFYGPSGIVRCANGNIFISDTGNNRIRKIDSKSGSDIGEISNSIIHSILGTGEASSIGEGRPSSLHPVDSPTGLACDEDNNLFVTSSTSVKVLQSNDVSGVRVVDGSGYSYNLVSNVLGTQYPIDSLYCASAIAISPGNVSASQVYNNDIYVSDACAGFLMKINIVRR